MKGKNTFGSRGLILAVRLSPPVSPIGHERQDVGCHITHNRHLATFQIEYGADPGGGFPPFIS